MADTDSPKPASSQPANKTVNKPKKPKQNAKGVSKDAPKKGPTKKTIALMQETLRKKKEDEEKLIQEEEEKIRKLEEAERAKELQLQREKERKEKKKQREKERMEKLKAEGKYLTGKQLHEKRRALTLLQSLQQGTIIANVTEKTENADKKKEETSSESEAETQEASKILVSLFGVRNLMVTFYFNNRKYLTHLFPNSLILLYYL